jgi:hypothetical protein
MENTGTENQTILEHVKGYYTTKLEILKLRGVEKTADVLSALFSGMILFVLGFVFLLLLTLGLIIKLAQYFNSTFTGFLVVSGLYLLVMLMLLVFRKSLLRGPLMNYFAGRLLKKIEQ